MKNPLKVPIMSTQFLVWSSLIRCADKATLLERSNHVPNHSNSYHLWPIL